VHIGDTGTAATEQCEEPSEVGLSSSSVILGIRLNPSLSGAGQPRHARHDLRELVDAESTPLDLS